MNFWLVVLLVICAVLTGISGAVWPILVKKSGLMGFVVPVVFCSVQWAVIALAYLARHPNPLANIRSQTVGVDWILLIIAGILGACTIVGFTYMNVKANQDIHASLLALNAIVTVMCFAVYNAYILGGMSRNKWIAFGLVALAIIMFFKTDKNEQLKKKSSIIATIPIEAKVR